MSFGIAAGHEKTMEAAKEILYMGGNAVDAAIASLWMMCFAEPCMASLGAGAFATINFNGRIHCLDFFCQTPMQKRGREELEFYPITVDFGSTTEEFQIGKGASATPGFIAGVFALHERFGSLPMPVLAEQAVHQAKEGILIDRFQAYDWYLLRNIFAIDKSVNEIYFKNGEIKKEGDEVRMDKLADAIENLAREGKALFYEGEIARSIVNDYEGSGSLTMSDFTNYRAIWRNPLSFKWNDYSIHSVPSPSQGGEIIAAVLKELENDSEYQVWSSGHFEDWAKVSKEIFELKTNERKLIEFLNNKHSFNLSFEPKGGKSSKGTSHFSIIDQSGNSVALTISIGEGNGYIIPETQMMMNNMLGEGALLPNGFHSWEPNQRLMSMMCPTLVTDLNGETRLTIGSGGAGRIPFVIGQAILYYLKHRLPIQKAVEAPRVFFDGEKIQVEKGFEISRNSLINEWESSSLYFGGTHAVCRERDKYLAISDIRRFGSSFTKD